MKVNEIYLGNSYELIKYIPDNSIDLIITDPEYDFEPCGGGGSFGTSKRNYLKDITFNLNKGIKDEILTEFERVQKKTNIYIFCNKNQLAQYLNFYKNKNVDVLVWNKTNPSPMVNNKYLSDLEYIVFARDKGVKMYNTYETSSKLFQTSVNKVDKKNFNHPTIKPLNIIKTLILNSSRKDDLVADFFLGSGTSCVASKELGRNYIGFEISKEYFEIARDRLNGINATGQTSIFTDFNVLQKGV